MKPVGLLDVRAALNDARFRDLFPEVKHEIDKYLAQPKCGACAVPVVREILTKFPERVKKYFPGRQLAVLEDATDNRFTVINCGIEELESKLRKLGPGRKQLAMARYEDQVTVVINEI